MKIPDSDFQKFFEASRAMKIVLAPDLRIVAVTDSFLIPENLQRGNVIDSKFFEIFPERSRDLTSSFERVLRSGEPDTTIWRQEQGVEDFKYWSSLTSPIFENNQISYLLHQVEEMTKFVQQENDLKNIQGERDLFFTYSFDLMGVVAKDGYFKRLNPAFERVLGFSNSELCSKPISEFLHPDDIAKTRAGIEILATGKPRIGSVNRYRCKDGTYKWFSWNTIPHDSLFYTMGRDITEQIDSERKIHELNVQLEEKNESLEAQIQDRIADLRHKENELQQLQKLDAIGRLAGGIAHDFNNLLGAIQMYCDLITTKISVPEIVIDGLKQIEKATERGSSLTRQLLIFSRTKMFEDRIIDLNDLLKDHFKMLNRLIGENISIDLNLSEQPPLISGDPSQLEQVIMNLVINSRDAMPDGGKILIETSHVNLTEKFADSHLASMQGPHILLSVTDTGCGMDEKTKSKIFEPFFTTKAVGQGTGLGLSTVYGIVKSLKGTIWVYTEVNQGTVFKIYIPSAEAIAIEEILQTREIVLSGDETILVVEDDANLRNLYGAALKENGYTVLLAENGHHALTTLYGSQSRIDMIVTDMIMPQMGGSALLEKLLTFHADMKVLCISGYPDEKLHILGADTRRIAYLQKPFNTKSLLENIRALLNNC